MGQCIFCDKNVILLKLFLTFSVLSILFKQACAQQQDRQQLTGKIQQVLLPFSWI